MSDSLVTPIILGIIEGITEFLPISSTGHLIIFGDLLNFSGEKAASFEIFIQLGAILSILALYPQRFFSLLDFKSTAKFKGKDQILKLFLACLPAFVLGFLFHDLIKEHLFSPLTVALALLFGGIAMILIDRDKSERGISLEEISLKQSFLIGVFQCLALWPGMSRSASTIIGGLLVGLNRKASAEFSFLVAVPVMFAATLYDLLKSYSALSFSDLQFFLTGFVVSFFVAVVAVKWFVKMLSNHTLAPFGYYRILVAALVLYVF